MTDVYGRWEYKHWRHRRWGQGAALLGALLVWSVADAQNLNAYQTLARRLDAAEAAAKRGGTGADAQLRAAQEALPALQNTIQNPQLAQGLQQAITGAQAAVSRTPAEVQANVLLARGLMRQALYEQTLGAMQTPGSIPQAGVPSSALNLLGREFGFRGSTLNALMDDAQQGSLNTVRWKLQRVAVRKVNAALKAPQGDATQTYLNLTRALSWFTLVQDLGGQAVPPVSVGQFQTALSQLTAGDQAGLGATTEQLRQGVGSLAQRFAQGQSGSGATVPPVSSQPSTGQPTPTPLPNTTTTPITGAPAAAGVDGAYAALARAQAAAGHGDPESARQALEGATVAYRTFPQTLTRTPSYERLVADTARMRERTGLRSTDVQGLIGLLNVVENESAGRAVAGIDGFASGVSRHFGGWVSAILLLWLAAACYWPLSLLRLAFGGSNTYWRAISGGLTFLLAPTVVWGIANFLGWLGDVFGWPFLRNMLNLSPTQGAAGAFWQIMATGLGIALLTYGFYGLCRQFGLLGRRVVRTANVRSTRYTHTSLDWEEEL